MRKKEFIVKRKCNRKGRIRFRDDLVFGVIRSIF